MRSSPRIRTDVPTGPDLGENDAIVGGALPTWKLVALVAVPAGVMTLMRPVVAVDGTVAVILESELTVNTDGTPLKRTSVAPVNPDPRIVTDVPTGPAVGEKEVIVGAAPPVTTKSVALVPVPEGVVTWIRPVDAPAGTDVVLLRSELTANTAETPPQRTSVAPLKSEPWTITVVPGLPDVGEKEEIVGGVPVTVKSWALVPVPSGVETLMGPVRAPAGTVARTCVSESKVKLADVFRKVTEVTPLKYWPVIVTTVSTDPLTGENDEISGFDAANAVGAVVDAVRTAPTSSTPNSRGTRDRVRSCMVIAPSSSRLAQPSWTRSARNGKTNDGGASCSRLHRRSLPVRRRAPRGWAEL
jgi:hypothetical protein